MPTPRVAVIGGGQLARMSAPPAVDLAIALRVLVESADAPAAQVIPDCQVGTPGDVSAVLELVDGADVLTFEHEHIPAAVLAAVEASGVPVRPAPAALLHAQDKIVMRQRLTELGVPCPRWAPVASADDVADFLAAVGGRCVAKTARGGYDGKGVRVISAPSQVADWLDAAASGGPRILLEELVPFVRELAVQIARTEDGRTALWPVVESVQVDGVCFEVIAPAPELDAAAQAQAVATAMTIADGLGVTGVLAVELFEVVDSDGTHRVVVNELAMRPHNSGHWSINGCETSQFAQHLRAVLGLPLGSTALLAPWSVMVNVLGSSHADLSDALPAALAADPAAAVHLYGKLVRPGRKIGHVTVTGDDLPTVRARANVVAAILRGDRAATTTSGSAA